MPAGYHAGPGAFSETASHGRGFARSMIFSRLALGCREVTAVGWLDRRDGERRVAVAPVMRHLATEPPRTQERLVGTFQLDLGHHQATIAAAEHTTRTA